MCIQILKKEIRILLSSMKLYLQQMPESKLYKNKASIDSIMAKFSDGMENPSTIQQCHKELQFKYNFFKLAYPYVLIPKEPEQKYEDVGDLDLGTYWSNVQNQKNEKEQQQENQELKSGKYILKDGQLVKGEASKRKQVEFSNWYASNADPDDLQKHKELLDRQHYRGPMWDGKPKPKSIINELPESFTKGEHQTEINPNLNDKNMKGSKFKDEAFENVKR